MPVLATMLLLCAACATMKPTQQSDSNFYKSSSQKMGVNFSGTEDKALIKASSSWMGVPYRYGGEEKTGVDCSGFVLNVFKEAYGITLPRTSAAMSKQVRRVRKDKLQCGDLLFFTVKDRRVSHVGIYMADNKFVHSSSSYGVSVADLGDTYWSKYFAGAGRVEVEDTQAQKLTVDNSAQREGRVASRRRTSSQPNRKGKVHEQKPHSEPETDVNNDKNKDDVIVVFDEEF